MAFVMEIAGTADSIVIYSTGTWHGQYRRFVCMYVSLLWTARIKIAQSFLGRVQISNEICRG